MKNMIVKDTIKEIKKSLGRFLSILAITALGVSFFAGIKVAPVFMRDSLDSYYDEQNYMDYTVLSTLGLTNEDILSIKNTEGILDVTPSKTMDLIINYDSRDMVVKAIGIPKVVFEGQKEGYVNAPLLVEGRMPENPNECLVEKEKMEEFNIPLGANLKVSTGTDSNINDSLSETEYTVVGYAQTPNYLSFEKGKSNIGKGDISNFIMIYQENFKMDIFTEAYVTVEGTKELNTFKSEYFEKLKPSTKSLEELGIKRASVRYDEVIGEANKKLLESEEELKKGKEEAEKQLLEGKNKLDSSREALNKGEKELQRNKEKFNITIKDAEEKISKGEEELRKGEEQYNQALNLFNESKKRLEPEIEKGKKEKEVLKGEKLSLEKRIGEIDKELTDPTLTQEEKFALEKEKMQATLKIENINYKINIIDEGLKAYNEILKEGENKLNEAKAKVDSGRKELETQKQNLKKGKEEGNREFEKARVALVDGREKLAQGEKDYEKGKKEAQLKIEDGERKLSEAREKIQAISDPEWYILDREKNYSYMSYKSSTDSVDAIAQIFPVFFFLVAALVCLTTMTRMVDEQRVNMGTLKALGYSKGKIASKYLVYAGAASICGSVIGLLVGINLFPTVIFEAYGIMFNVPTLLKEFNLYYSSLATLSAVAITTLAAYMACHKELKEVPSALMRPKAPPEGKRILIERIPLLWNRLNFIGKVTARNIFRYKKRFLMTVIGISGCTALLLAGFGIKDSIEVIAEKQFGEIFKYNMLLSLDEKSTLEDLERINSYLVKDNGIEKYMNLETKYQKAFNEKGEKDVNLIVPKEVENLRSFINLRERASKREISLTDEGVVITEKLAKSLNVKVGDEIGIRDENGYSHNVKVTGISENYVSNYVYMTGNLYEKIHGAKPRFNSIMTINNSTDKEFEKNISEKLSEEEKISSVSFNSGIEDSFDDTISSLNIVVVVMIVSAGALAFVVLYNLTNVNISERLREIATIKVLGFYDNEVSSYVFRENFILTFIGSLTGLLLGSALHRFIIVTAEMEAFMFGRNLDLTSCLYSIVLTVVFAAIVNFAMYYKLKNVPMVESLKSVD